MTAILRQFLAESRDFLQSIGQKLLQLEDAPNDAALMSDLFRSVHTLKGNSGLFDFPEMSRVLHAAEDLMSVVRDERLAYDRDLADYLLDAMDFVAMLLDEIEASGQIAGVHATASARHAEQLRRRLQPLAGDDGGTDAAARAASPADVGAEPFAEVFGSLPAAMREAWRGMVAAGGDLSYVSYAPEVDCFFKGEDPFHQVRQIPGVIWNRVTAAEARTPLAELDPYRCLLHFAVVSTAPRAAIEAHFRYVPEQIAIRPLTPAALAEPSLVGVHPRGAASGGGFAGGGVAAEILRIQLGILGLPDSVPWASGRLKAAGASVIAALGSLGLAQAAAEAESRLAEALAARSAEPLQSWLRGCLDGVSVAPTAPTLPAAPDTPAALASAQAERAPDVDARAGRRSDETASVKTLKVDQEKVDKLMNLIGEMIVAKNGLPFLASRAEAVYGVRELAREIKAHHAVINRVAGEMQDAIMQIRMLPVSFVFQRFPRLVRDISRKLGKEVDLVLEGESTEADKNIIEALADPLIHIVRNSLDHGIEMPDVRRAAGKPPAGRLVIRASQQADRVCIDIIDDGKGIDPAIVKRKAYQNGLIDASALERLSEQEAIDLIFAAGFSTAESVSDLSGRGVGMDVVRSAVSQVGGTVTLDSTVGQGTRLRLALPLSMAVTNVMVVESNAQIFGIPMDVVLESVRVPRNNIRSIKNRHTTVLRNRIMPLRSLNELLATDVPQAANDDDEVATLVVEVQGERVGIMVDGFREVTDIILKPMHGVLNSLGGYSGSALLGDGSILMVLNPKELVTWQ
jgi:two-component system chemotaxis sensor kinase CheA